MNAFITLLLVLLPIFLLLTRGKRASKRLPPGSLGIPVIGQSLSFLRAMRANKSEKWLEERIEKYGPIWKASLFGKPTVFIYGQAANKFIFTNNDGKTLSNARPKSTTRLLGNRNLLELTGKDHKRLRDALMMFLRPDSLKQYVGKMDREIREHIDMYWRGKEKLTVMPLMKTLTFNILCTLIFGLDRGACRENLLKYCKATIEGIWSVPINMAFTRYNRSIHASKMANDLVKGIIKEKREKLEENRNSIHQDLISCLLTIREDGKEAISEEEIMNNVMLVMFAGHDTSATLLTFFMMILGSNPNIYETVFTEQEEIAKNKQGEHLTWEDLAKMKYTWRVALETLRIYPPAFGSFRKAMRDIEYGGYLIRKGWQVFWASCMTHMDDSIFPEPSDFDPKRFENQASLPPYTYIAFGAGPRICPGYEFARIETLITIHYLVTQFTWKLCHTDNGYSRNPLPVPTEGLPILIKPKEQP